MGLMQRAVETYDFMQKQTPDRQPAPISHMTTRADLEITINETGTFCSANAVSKDEPKTVIPTTESSRGRTSGVCAHPLCDQLQYVAAYNDKKHTAYVSQLEKWTYSEESHPKLLPILTYVKGGTILSDLERCRLIKRDSQGGLENEEKSGKLLVRWRVIGLDDNTPDTCFEDSTLFDSFIRFYQKEHSEDPVCLCMISGEHGRRAEQHPKGIIPISGNAKLISSNDTSGFTYRGRFTNEEQALEISYEASQKAHNALQWLASEQGVIYGGRTFLCWNPQGHEVCHVVGAFANFSKPQREPTNYQAQLKKTLEGYQSQLPKTAGVVIAAFDAATSGRLSLTYYNELQNSDFLQRLYDWDNTCCWYTYFGIQSPPLWQIVNCAFGTQREEKGKMCMKTDDRVMRQQIQRLIACRVDKRRFPADIMQSLVHRASSPLGYEANVRKTILSTACAVIRKYHLDREKEDWDMTLQPNKEDRSYQFGRLLAILEKAERDTFGNDETREPNAIRQQSVFCQRPLYAANNIEGQLERAYFPRLSPGSRMFYKKLIGEIMEQIGRFPEEQWNQPLRETYLLGYYLQRNALYTSKHQNTMEENDHDSTEE
ncbi:type I-C CRISPR-associated protein Cas8c/Csd1 [Phocea massiliensis]|uniref:Type I-C CRISPR-associated protein Cas8c/Csd1 n=1 Tax=Merdimmobilis hominis TaxID=2897707 RepID=A0A938X8W0_9FIRM|nr:type I-C CRISPR-associated protein Cas8c/Csd1 [Merdimmobilis hominis]MBM6921532.1 type I-C CRISPR-associated protein Cas8c/Csd1 [Merdimmobilis hominis]